MEKKQDIPLEEIINTLQNITTIRHADEEFEELPLPANSSYLPISAVKTAKQPVPKSKIVEEIKE